MKPILWQLLMCEIRNNIQFILLLGIRQRDDLTTLTWVESLLLELCPSVGSMDMLKY